MISVPKILTVTLLAGLFPLIQESSATLLTYKNKYVVTSSTPVTSSAGGMVDDTQAGQTFPLSANQTVLIIYSGHNVSGDAEQGISKQIAISVDGADKANTWNSNFTPGYPCALTTFWIGTLEAGSHTIRGRFASYGAGQSSTIRERSLLIYILNGDEFRYVDDATPASTPSDVFVDDPHAGQTFAPSANCKALILYNAGVAVGGGEMSGAGKKTAINISGADYSQAEHAPGSTTYGNSVFTMHYAALSAKSYTVNGRFACNEGASGGVAVARRQLGILLFADSTLADYVSSDTQVSTGSAYPQDDTQARAARTTTDTRELLVLAMGTKRAGTTSSGDGEAYGIKVDAYDRTKSRGSHGGAQVNANSESTVWAETLAAGGHTVQGRFGNNAGSDNAVIDSRRIVALWFSKSGGAAGASMPAPSTVSEHAQAAASAMANDIVKAAAPAIAAATVKAVVSSSPPAASPKVSNSADVRINSNNDDAEEKEDGTITYLNSTDLELTRDDALGAGNQKVGLRFNNVKIPRGARITSAYVQFTCDEITSDACSLTIRGQAADNSAILTDKGGDISTRAMTAATVNWIPPSWDVENRAGTAERTTDIAPIIQEIVSRPGWADGNSLVIVITGTGRRTAESFEGASTHGNGALAPSLHVVWEGAGTAPASAEPGAPATAMEPAKAPSPTPTPVAARPPAVLVNMDIRLNAGGDDAEEKEDGSTTYLNSSDLELVRDAATGAGNQKVGVRFNNVAIPQGTRISSAYIQFTCDEVTSDACSLTIKGQSADNAPAFTDRSRDISARPMTTATVRWALPTWDVEHRAGAAERTPEIAPIIQEIVNRQGWVSGNSLVIVITGTGTRTAESFEGATTHGNNALAPLLHVVLEGVAGAAALPAPVPAKPSAPAQVAPASAAPAPVKEPVKAPAPAPVKEPAKAPAPVTPPQPAPTQVVTKLPAAPVSAKSNIITVAKKPAEEKAAAPAKIEEDAEPETDEFDETTWRDKIPFRPVVFFCALAAFLTVMYLIFRGPKKK